MGEVHLAEDTLLHRMVAIKRLRLSPGDNDAESAERIMRQARVASRIQHRNAVAIHDLVIDNGRPHVIMEYVRGETLADLITRNGRLPSQEAARIIGQIASALDAASRLGFVHRDVKPANIMVGLDAEAKLADFGIARSRQDASLTQAGSMIGTVAYMAPEVARGSEATAASDVWSLGATLYAAVEGHAPYDRGDSPSITTLLTRLATEPLPQPAHAGPLTSLLTSMTSTDAIRRPTAGRIAR